LVQRSIKGGSRIGIHREVDIARALLTSQNIAVGSAIAIDRACFVSRRLAYIGWFISSGRDPPETTLPQEFRICCFPVIAVSIVG
jgi:hypothetical protein